jgi:hypothetical protein
MLSPTYDFKIFLGKIRGKNPDEVLSAAEREIHSLEFASPQKRTVSFAYLRELRLLISYIHVPPQPEDRRGPVPEHIKRTLRNLGLLSPRKERRSPSLKRFEVFLKKLHQKTWREALDLIDVEVETIRATKSKPDKYLAHLCRLVSYLRYPTDPMPKAYGPVLLNMIELPAVLKEKL